MVRSALQTTGERWLLLLHQLPTEQAYVRVKTWRALQAVGAVTLKNSICALPVTEQARRDFERLLLEIKRSGGDGAICEARFISGLRDDQIRALFNMARDTDYDSLIKELRALNSSGKGRNAKN